MLYKPIIRPSDNALMWTWFTGPFGVEAPNENPQGIGTFVYDLRFPGQIAGAWGSTLQNTYRDYDPAVGRYVESDPIGLRGGSPSTYAFVAGDPLSLTDPKGTETGTAYHEIYEWDLPPKPTPPLRCPTVPTAPPGVDINDNLSVAEDYSWLNPGADLAFLQLARHGGIWDYRTNQGQQYDDFGNFNYGATAAAMGFPYYVVQNVAGYAQGDSSTGSGIPLFEWPYGDDLPGASQIRAGYDYEQAREAGTCGCGK